MIALGKRISGVMGDAGALRAGPSGRRPGRRAGVADAAAGRGAQGHGLRHRRHLPGRRRHGPGGPHAAGRAFLREFVTEGLAWAHIDIAGPAYHSGEPTGYLAKGGTGVPVRLLLDLIEDIATNG